jgi:CBS domain-containing protein
MTEKLARRDAGVRTEYSVDHLAHVLVREAASRDVVSLSSQQTVYQTRQWLAEGAGHPRGPATHQGFPVLDAEGLLIGVVTRRDLVDNSRSGDELLREIVSREPAVVFEDNTLRDAADHMVLEQVGRLPVVSRDNPRKVVGMISRSDLLSAHAPRLAATLEIERARKWRS